MKFIEISDQYINIEHITSVSFCNDTAIHLLDGRKIWAEGVPAEDVMEMIDTARWCT